MGGVLEKECDQINEDYRHWTTKREPWVILKLAMTMDGYLAVPGRKWITGKQAREQVQHIRAGCDAILVGAETVRKDNPRLTVRNGPVGEQPTKGGKSFSGSASRSDIGLLQKKVVRGFAGSTSKGGVSVVGRGGSRNRKKPETTQENP